MTVSVSYRDAISILQIGAFIPVLILGLLLNLRHGFAKSSGWIFLITLSLLRIVGAICWIVYDHNGSTGAATGAIICTSIGLSPLTLICLALLSRVNDFTTNRISSFFFRGPNLISMVGLILGITGGVKASNSSEPLYINVESKAAMIIFTVVFLIAVVNLVLLALRVSQVENGERRLLIAVAICCPFIAVRVLYGLLSDFANSNHFSSAYGSKTIYLCMAVIEEIIVVAVCIAVGFTLAVVPRGSVKTTSPQDQEADTGKYPHTAQTTPHRQRKAKGPISWLYIQATDYAQSRKAAQPVETGYGLR